MAITAIYKGLFFAWLLVGVLAEEEPLTEQPEEVVTNVDEAKLMEAKLLQEQAASAVYNFATSLIDGIMDNMQLRTESRDGLNLTGSYSYSDGYFRRSVSYIADENGYRVISESVEPLGDGPRFNPDGQANVRTSIAGENFEYNITRADIGKFHEPAPGTAEA